ncbi:HAMP domain-containing histidine kinase [Burkholderia ambifaria]|uniref:sensor histidine kinase n=1 Tax=Burkholderia ambifaria TaxID=152480 RepID=UPI00158F630A|nr:HAMP domain-containing sensor histidine kinase [Burkholderia ambifaria]QQJ96009.1 HAMP domain-containing histidine kinase [Burkholderia ambifaria]
MDADRAANFTRRWHTTTFRWLCAYAAIFSVSLLLLAGVINVAATHTMARDTDEVLAWQLIYFDSIPDAELPLAIHRRLEHEHMHTNFYGLFDANGRRVAGDIATPPVLRTDRRGRTLDRTLVPLDGQPAPITRAMAVHRDDGMTLVVARDLSHFIQIREVAIRGLVIGGVLILIAGIAGGSMLGMRQIRRVAAIRRVTRQIAEGDLGKRLPVGRYDELDLLAHLVNHMLDEVERLMGEVRHTCDGIAHDLRTPLARVHTMLARLAEQPHCAHDPASAQLLASARDETDRLLERFRAMLRISEIGTLSRRGGFAAVDVAALLRDVCELYEPLAEAGGVAFGLDAMPVDGIHGDRALLFEAFSNLADNAIKFTPPGGRVRVALHTTPNGPLVRFEDTGPGIAPGERDAVLERFYRGERTRHVNGSGLGLSIVSAVMRVHGFALRIGDAQPAGAAITVECWPRSLG